MNLRQGRRRQRGLIMVVALLGGIGLALTSVWCMLNVIDSDLRPWAAKQVPEPEGLVQGARHDGWLALIGLQHGHLDDTRAQGLRSWTRWDTERRQALALPDTFVIHQMPEVVKIESSSPLSCQPPTQCGELLAQRVGQLPAALQAAAPLAQVCERLSRSEGFEEPSTLVSAWMPLAMPGHALRTCSQLWIAQLALARHRQDADTASRAWASMQRVSTGLFEGSRSLVNGSVASAWLQAAHVEGFATARAFPALRDRVRQQMAAPLPWQQVAQRWWASEGAALDHTLFESLDALANVECDKGAATPQGRTCTAKRWGGPFPRLMPVLPNMTRSLLRERLESVAQATDEGEPAKALARLSALATQREDTAWMGLHVRNTIGRILLSVASPETLARDYLPRAMDVELSRQAVLLGLDALDRQAAGQAVTEASIKAAAGSSAFTAGRVRCEAPCRALAITSWRSDAKAPKMVWSLSP